MIKLKSCPRCGGDIIIDRDHHGWYEDCMYCGYERDLKILEVASRETIHQEKYLPKTRLAG